MKTVKKISLIFLCIIFTSCYDGQVNGRKYCLQKTCIKSHNVTGMRLVLIGKLWTNLPYQHIVCDKYKIDTIWINN